MAMQQLAVPITVHMAQHIVLMNALAPLVAIALNSRHGAGGQFGLAAATAVQLLLLWGWHSPPVLAHAMNDPVLHLVMQMSLLGAAIWFWQAIFAVHGSGRWRAIIALLITSKLFCLLGVLMVFAPRALFSFAASSHMGHSSGGLDDQQLAGLLMLVACPSVYVLSGVIIAGRWFAALEREGAPGHKQAASA